MSDLRREILSDLRTHLEMELQAERRKAPLDSAVAAAFLAAAPAKPAPAAAAAPAPRPGTVREPAPAAAAAATPLPRPPIVPASADDVAACAAAAATLEDVAAAIRCCKACHLAPTRTLAVPGVGNAAQPDILFIGEAPGADEDRQGIPFIGRAGQLLTKMIEAMGYTRDEVFIANIIKCRPPANRTPTPDEMRLCMPYLRRQIELIRPKVIVALGSTACKGLCEQQGTFSTVRGIWQTFGKIPVMPTFHPAYVLRVPSVKRTVWQDLQAVLARLGRPVPPVRAAAPTAKG